MRRWRGGSWSPAGPVMSAVTWWRPWSERGDSVVVLDNLRTGHRGAVPAGVQLIVADLADTGAVDAVLADGPWHAVFHFASLSQVGESMRLPFRYLIDNGVNGMRLIEACVRHGIIALRAVLDRGAVRHAEDGADPGGRAAPSGIALWRQQVVSRAHAALGGARARAALCVVALLQCCRRRSGGTLRRGPSAGDASRPAGDRRGTGRRAELEVYGDDYATPDGTCLRDYVHVTDLADAHLLALDRLERGSITVNLGNGTGHSVLQVIEAVERVSERKVPYRICPRRPGDAAVLVASSEARATRTRLATALRRSGRNRAYRAALARGAPQRLCATDGRTGTVAVYRARGRTAAVAGILEWLSAGVLRHRHLSVAGDRALCRLGPADLLQPVPAAAAPDADHLASDRRAGAAGGACAAPGAADAAARGIGLVAAAARRHDGGCVLAAMVRRTAHAGCVHRHAGACPGAADPGTRAPVAHANVSGW